MGRATNALRNPSYQTDRRVRLKIHRSKWGEQQLRSKIHRTKYIKTTSKMRPVRNDMGGHPGQVPCESSGATSISTRGSTWSGRVYEYIIVAEPPLSKRHRVSNVPDAPQEREGTGYSELLVEGGRKDWTEGIESLKSSTRSRSCARLGHFP